MKRTKYLLAAALGAASFGTSLAAAQPATMLADDQFVAINAHHFGPQLH